MGALASGRLRTPADVAVSVETPDATAPGTGTDTSYDHLLPLLVEFAELGMRDPGRPRLREELLRGFLPVAHNIARRYRGRGEPIADLEQVATIGLLGALERFDPHRGSAFLSFAVPTITGEIRRHFRDRTWSTRVPRSLKDLQGPVRDQCRGVSRSAMTSSRRPWSACRPPGARGCAGW